MANWDIQSAAPWNSAVLLQLSPTVWEPSSGVLSSGGTRMAMYGVDDPTGFTIRSYTLSSPFDITTAVLHSESSILTTANSVGFAGSTDGRFFYSKTDAVLTPIRVQWWEMTTPWDATTTTYRGELQLTGNTSGSGGMTIDAGGTHLYLWNTNNPPNRLERWDLSTAWDVSTASLAQTLNRTPTLDEMFISADGLILVSRDHANDRFVRHDFGTAWDLSTLSSSTVQVKSYSGTTTFANGSMVSPQGHVLYFYNPLTGNYHAWNINYSPTAADVGLTVGYLRLG